MKNIPRQQIALTVSALGCWLMLYAVGLLLESIEYRILLAPVTMKKQLGDGGKDLYNKVMNISQSDISSLPSNDLAKNTAQPQPSVKPPADAASKPQTEAVAKTSAETGSKTPVDAPEKGSLKSSAKHCDPLPEPRPSLAWAFFAAFCCYSPTNMAMLTLTAGFLGGCVSNVVLHTMDEAEREKLPERQLAFLSENPLSATMRGFVIYLCLVAGLYVAMDDPFKDSTPGQYARLAGSLSLVAFVVGYDPTRIEGWLRMTPGPLPSK
jgi:hypothetical protein